MEAFWILNLNDKSTSIVSWIPFPLLNFEFEYLFSRFIEKTFLKIFTENHLLMKNLTFNYFVIFIRNRYVVLVLSALRLLSMYFFILVTFIFSDLPPPLVRLIDVTLSRFMNCPCIT